jgi:hypothetical protein
MPLWKSAELDACRRLPFPDVTAEEAKNFFDIWGGVPRFVLEKAPFKQTKTQHKA